MKKYISPEYNNFAIELEDVLQTSYEGTGKDPATDSGNDGESSNPLIQTLDNVDW